MTSRISKPKKKTLCPGLSNHHSMLLGSHNQISNLHKLKNQCFRWLHHLGVHLHNISTISSLPWTSCSGISLLMELSTLVKFRWLQIFCNSNTIEFCNSMLYKRYKIFGSTDLRFTSSYQVQVLQITYPSFLRIKILVLFCVYHPICFAQSCAKFNEPRIIKGFPKIQIKAMTSCQILQRVYTECNILN